MRERENYCFSVSSREVARREEKKVLERGSVGSRGRKCEEEMKNKILVAVELEKWAGVGRREDDEFIRANGVSSYS